MVNFDTIKGIGKKTSDALYRGGIESFEQLAALSADEIENILSVQGISVRSDIEQWRSAARDLIPTQSTTIVGGAEVPDSYTDSSFEQIEIDYDWNNMPNQLHIIVALDDEQYERLTAICDSYRLHRGPRRLTPEQMVMRLINETARMYGQDEV